ncbi:MAG: hypothetical protein RXO35_03955 [Candidatus Micrarchaeota archaeon]
MVSPRLNTLLIGILLILFLYILSLLSYMPKVKETSKDKQIYTLTKK